MPLLAVLAQHLAVIADRGHHGAALVAGQSLEQPADLAVHERDLARVARGRRSPPRPPRRVVGRVRVVVVDPEEVRPARGRASRPGQGRVGHRRRVPLGIAVLADPLGGHPVVVEWRSRGRGRSAGRGPATPRTRRWHSRGPQGPVASVGRPAGSAAVPLSWTPWPGRIQPGEERAVGGQGQRRRGERPRVARPPGRQGVEVRGEAPAHPLGAEVVGAGGVEGEEHQGRAPGRPPAGGSLGDGCGGGRGECQPHHQTDPFSRPAYVHWTLSTYWRRQRPSTIAHHPASLTTIIHSRKTALTSASERV